MPNQDQANVTRAQAQAIEAYLQTLTGQVGGIPAGVSVLSLAELDERIRTSTRLVDKAQWIAKRHARQAYEEGKGERETLERGFVDNAFAYSTEHGITYAVWREMGVPVKVLRAAGFKEPGQGWVRPEGVKKRQRWTPEFEARVRAIIEDAGGPGYAARDTLADTFGWTTHHTIEVCRKKLGTRLPYGQPGQPEPLSANGTKDAGTNRRLGNVDVAEALA